MRTVLTTLVVPLLIVTLSGCGTRLPVQSPPLADMEESLALRQEPNDEKMRVQLPFGTFSGLRVDDGHDTLSDILEGEKSVVRVVEVIENSPADKAGILPDDIIQSVRTADSPERPISSVSEWRQEELKTAAGTVVTLRLDRAGRIFTTGVTLEPRVRPAARQATAVYREEQQVGVVLRQASEVEARAADLGPGAGLVVIGLSHSSPWRAVGIRFGDLLVAIEDQPITHAQVLFARLHQPNVTAVKVHLRRGQETLIITAPLARRATQLREFWLPILFSYEANYERTEWSTLWGFLGYEGTAAAWRFQFLWFCGIGGGDRDRLQHVVTP